MPSETTTEFETVEIHRATTVDDVYYDAQRHIVPASVARELVKAGAATILQAPEPETRTGGAGSLVSSVATAAAPAAPTAAERRSRDR